MTKLVTEVCRDVETFLFFVRCTLYLTCCVSAKLNFVDVVIELVNMHSFPDSEAEVARGRGGPSLDRLEGVVPQPARTSPNGDVDRIYGDDIVH